MPSCWAESRGAMIGGAERGYRQLAQAQGDVREVYRGGFVGQLVSGAVWLLAAAAGTWLSAGAAVIVLWVGGVLIFPLTSWCLRLSGRPAALPGGHPMAALATQIAFTVPPGMLVAVALASRSPSTARSGSYSYDLLDNLGRRQPARLSPTWTSHGQISAGRAAIVMARVALNVGLS